MSVAEGFTFLLACIPIKPLQDVNQPRILASEEGYFVAIITDIPTKLPARGLEVILRKKKTLDGGAEELCLWNIFPP